MKEDLRYKTSDRFYVYSTLTFKAKVILVICNFSRNLHTIRNNCAKNNTFGQIMTDKLALQAKKLILSPCYILIYETCFMFI